ncbi:MAG: deoxyguanosinetriphosphate triphosphohydrolase [Nakamurella sp.]
MSTSYPLAAYAPEDAQRRFTEGRKVAVLPGADAITPRGPFARDRARVLHSASFRRLAGKTQVVAPDEDEVPRTRLTHSLEVAQIAREIGALLGCDADLVDLAGLAHDIGHPPFGHNGERALDEVADHIGGFEANAQNLRLLTRLEAKVIGPDGTPLGLNLTRAALDAVVKYPWTRPVAGGKFGVYADDVATFGWVRATLPIGVDGGARCLEAQAMDWADDVAYSVHDVEDGIHSGRVVLARLTDPAERHAVCANATGRHSSESVSDLEQVLLDLLDMPVVDDARRSHGSPEGESALLRMTSELTGRFATGAVLATRQSAGDGPLHRYDTDLVVPRLLVAEVAVLKSIAHLYVMQDPVRQELQNQQRRLLVELVLRLVEIGRPALDPGFAEMFAAADSDDQRLRVVVDQVSLLTDAQALARHRRWVRHD